MKIGIYMGSFNPPHKGHINIVNYLLKKKIIDRVIIVPTLNYWDKNSLVDIKDRIAMLKFFENDNIIIDEEHNQYVKTYELLVKLEEKYPDDTLYPIIGADNLVSFTKWFKYEELLKYSFIVFPRKNIDGDSLIRSLKAPFIFLKHFPLVDISSTEIRKNINNDNIDYRVKKYIEENHLYEEEKNEKKN